MLHSLLSRYLRDIENAIRSLEGAYVERYEEEILTASRINLRVRIRFSSGYLLEVNEAVVVESEQIRHLGYRYHYQDRQNNLVFRLFPMKVNYPFGIRKTLGFFICIHLLNAYQTLSQSQILKAILCLHDNVQIVNDTFFHYNESENLWTI